MKATVKTDTSTKISIQASDIHKSKDRRSFLLTIGKVIAAFGLVKLVRPTNAMAAGIAETDIMTEAMAEKEFKAFKYHANGADKAKLCIDCQHFDVKAKAKHKDGKEYAPCALMKKKYVHAGGNSIMFVKRA